MTDLLVIQGVSCYEENGVAYLRLEDVARGLGFTKTDVKLSETGFRKEYVRIDWPRIRRYLKEFNFPIDMKTEKHEFIPENVFYRLAMKAKNDVAEAFQVKVANEIIPSIRKTGSYQVESKRNSEIGVPNFELSELVNAIVDIKNELTLIRKTLSNGSSSYNYGKTYKAPTKAFSPWRQEVYSILKPLARRMNTTTKAIASSIYNRMKKDYGWDFKSEKNKYFSSEEKVSGIDVVEESEMFKSVFMSILKDIYEQNTPITVNEHGVIQGHETKPNQNLLPIEVGYIEKTPETPKSWAEKSADLIKAYGLYKGDKSKNNCATFKLVFNAIDPIQLRKIEIKYIQANGGNPKRKIQIFNTKKAFDVLKETIDKMQAKEK